MSLRMFLGLSVIAAAAVAGCYTGSDGTSTTLGSAAPAPSTTVDGTEPTAGAVSGVPCDVAQVLARSCASCHGSTPTGGAPNAMMSYDDLVAAAVSNPDTSIATLSIERMQDTKSPMPPDGAAAEDLAVLEKWVADGMPKGTTACDAVPAASIYDTASVCTSGKKWTGGDRGNKLMRPGGACVDCHDREPKAPTLYAGGTVYATAHEPDDCNGTSSTSVKVVVTGADGKAQTATVNAAGNFYFESPIKMPYKAKVISGTKSRSMSASQSDGDCNKCHTETGLKEKKTPGRVMAP